MTTLAVHERFARWAIQGPSATAVVYRDRRLTYGRLNEQAEALAAHLRSSGIGPGKLVGISAHRDLELIVAIIGVLKAGAAYLPLDPAYPDDRLDVLIDDSHVDTVVTISSLASRLVHSGVRVILIDRLPDPSTSLPAPVPGNRGRLDDLAYVMYTSGSTGNPNGVMVSHRNVARLFDATQHWYGFGPSDVWTLFHSYAFDFSVWEMWGALAHGGTLVIVPHVVSRTPQLFRQLVRDQRVTVLNQTPSAFYQFIQADRLGRSADSLALRYVIFGGEALDFPSLSPWFERHGDQGPQLVNMYGITETTVHVTYRPVTMHDAMQESASLIGTPIPDLSLHVLGHDMQPVSPGAVGELYVGGAGVSLGYLNRPELTRERFVPDPFHPSSAQPLYKTGDLARIRTDGEIEYHGRADDQIQLRGFRVELGEVQATLASHPAVASAVVAVAGEGTARRLVGYVVRRSEGGTEHELREWMASRLPEHMLPSALVFLDRLPLTPNGKVDREALPRPARRQRGLDQQYAAPRDDLERYLVQIWEELLQLDCIGIHDRFFELGGTSLQAAQFINRLQQKLGAPIFDITIFSAPSIARYARFLVEHYHSAVTEHFDVQGGPDEPSPDVGGGLQRVTPELLVEMRRCIPVLSNGAMSDTSQRLEPALFILAPPRSGTTLLRVMLAGHPQLFAAAELLLLGFDTLADRRLAYSGKFSLWREGLLRALVEIHSCSADHAEQMMQSAEAEGMTAKGLFRRIQEWITPRMLVDKSPAYALQPSTLQAAERDFRDPLYIHLVRHPAAMGQSFTRARIEQVLYLEPHPFDARTLAEMVWTVSHQTVLDFLRKVPARRQHRMRFEDLVIEPEQAMRELCSGLGLPFDPKLLRPYQDVGSKMVDGLHPESTPMGDPSFLTHGQIRGDAADRWREAPTDDLLGDVTWRLAEELGYRRTGGSSISADAGGRRRLLVQQRTRRAAHRPQ